MKSMFITVPKPGGKPSPQPIKRIANPTIWVTCPRVKPLSPETPTWKTPHGLMPSPE